MSLLDKEWSDEYDNKREFSELPIFLSKGDNNWNVCVLMHWQGLSHKKNQAWKCFMVPNNSGYNDGYIPRWYHEAQETFVSVYCAAMRVNSPQLISDA